MNPEQRRLEEDRLGQVAWRHWGPYVSERQWGTVREDYSADGDAWAALTHEQARSRAYRWGEDGLGGLCDAKQALCLGLALWNGQDPILKERLFGLTGSEGNHGEDVKELYYYLDGTPTHSYMKMLYKYPQAAYPYQRLVDENHRRSRDEPEYEVTDTGVFAEERYFDVYIEQAKAGPDDILIRYTVHNRGPVAASLDLIPQLWFRNTWTWAPGSPKPSVVAGREGALHAQHAVLGNYSLSCDPGAESLFCENESDPALWGGGPAGPCKDGFHRFVVAGDRSGLAEAGQGTKAGLRYRLPLAPGASAQVRLRLSLGPAQPLDGFDAVMAARVSEADGFYAELQAGLTDPDKRRVQRQAWAGLLWSKQYYGYDVRRWLDGDPGQPPPPPQRRAGRNHAWEHLHCADVISMPDKWEYPWFASWDLAFHCIAFSALDPDFAKSQLLLLTKEWYQHPNGQLPAYEWAFGDVNPPVHALAAWQVYQRDARTTGKPDKDFLERVFLKLCLNFTWWVNCKDAQGNNLFDGGFLGLDNIGLFDRSQGLPGGGHLEQADATGWMAMYALNLMRIALELAPGRPAYEDMATKFFEHFLGIARAMTRMGDGVDGLWDEADGFFYDQLRSPDGSSQPLKVRSIVGLVPLFAVEILEPALLERLPAFKAHLEWFLKHRPDLAALVSRWHEPGQGDRRLLSLLRGHRIQALLARLLDETAFLSPHGVRALSKEHASQPCVLRFQGRAYSVDYEPAESRTGLFGGNSNWRGPVWMPMNYLIVEALGRFHDYYGEGFQVECPSGSGRMLSLGQAAAEIRRRLCGLFLDDAQGRRPVFGHEPLLRDGARFKDHLLFYEYFDGDSGRGAGASHQTGWTGLVALLLADQP